MDIDQIYINHNAHELMEAAVDPRFFKVFKILKVDIQTNQKGFNIYYIYIKITFIL